MISGSGYGLFAVIGVYVICLFTASKLVPPHASNFAQTLLLLATCVFSTALNYVLAKALNKKGVKHTVFGARLETAVLCLGGVLLFLALMMLGGALKDLTG